MGEIGRPSEWGELISHGKKGSNHMEKRTGDCIRIAKKLKVHISS
jgi:hypothetical protein